jgi:putative CocE/NonD family hydrolase
LGGAPQQYRLIPQAGKPVFSKQTSWESPDPNFWVPAGYAIVNMNLPGYANSEGPSTVFSEIQSKCYYEAIEWIAKQPWCTGKVGLNGVSFLAITQLHVASEGCIPTDFLKEHPLYDDWWKEKAAKLDEITIPMLV